MKNQDTGKMNDMVRLSLTITDRNERTHTYAYRNVMRYSCDERDDGNVYIHFRNEPYDRIHQAVDGFNSDIEGTDLMRFVIGNNPRLLSGDPEAAGKVIGDFAVALGAMLSLIELRVNEATRCAVRDHLVKMIDVNTQKSTEKTLEMIKAVAEGKDVFNGTLK